MLRIRKKIKMFVRRRYKLILVVFALIGVYHLFIRESPIRLFQEYQVKDESLQHYLIWTPKCKTLDLDPWDPSIRQYVGPVESIKFEEIKPLIRIEKRDYENVLKIQEGNDEIDCCYSVITRRTQKYGKHTSEADNGYLKSTCRHFDKETTLSNTTEFIYVECNNGWYTIYKNVHAVVPILPAVADRIKNVNKNSKKLNVLLLGIDSLSRLALLRLMPHTVDYFQQNQWVELKGYNKIGPNTFQNLLAVLTGRNYTVNYKICRTIDPQQEEPCRIVWDDYKENGYITAYAEDFPAIATFNYLQTGFVSQPTDYYSRPFYLAGDDLFWGVQFRGYDLGFGSVPYKDSLINYTRDFLETFNDYNYFGLFWTNRCHDYNNLAIAMDSTFKNFLADLKRIGTYENTLIIAFSDHGSRFGKLRRTPVGYYEERLPFIYIWVPQWYREKYPEKYENLLINGNRLTTPYDVYLTIYNLLNENGTSDACPKCQSLFEEIPDTRTCEDAAIDKTWCMCTSFKEISPKDLLMVRIGQFLFRKVEETTQELLKKFNLNERLCEKRRLLNINRGAQSISTGGDKDEDKEFVLEIETYPGPATFEAKIKVRHNNVTGDTDMMLVGSISRLDSYAKVAGCVHIVELKYFCHCR